MALLNPLNPFAGTADDGTVALYHAIVAQARLPVFYASLGVPDSLDGRFDMLVLHVTLVMRRMGDAAEAKQRLFDFMFADMDRSLREMGVGDMSIGKKIKPMMQAFHGRATAYDDALGTNDEALVAVLTKNLYGAAFGKAGDAAHAGRMAEYMRASAAALERQSLDTILAGKVAFPAPAAA